MRQNKKFAVTGGIGSGKSTALAVIKELGYPAFSCDEIYSDLLKEQDFLAVIAREFPHCVNKSGLDRGALATIAFSGDQSIYDRLNSVTHPHIINRLMEQMNAYPVSFAEVPLLYEGGFDRLFDCVIAVCRNKEDRIRAVSNRSNLSREEIERRISKQIDENVLRSNADFIVENDGTTNGLKRAIKEVLDRLL